MECALDGRRLSTRQLGIRFRQQRLDGRLGFRVAAFANMAIANASALVDQVLGGPVAIAEGAPSLAVVVLRDGIFYAQIRHGLGEIIQILFVIEFGVMVADNDQPLVRVFRVPFPQRGNRAFAVYSPEGPHVNQYDLTSQVG